MDRGRDEVNLGEWCGNVRDMRGMTGAQVVLLVSLVAKGLSSKLYIKGGPAHRILHVATLRQKLS